MRLTTRMALLGAVLPAALLALAFVAVGQALGWMLVRGVDESLTREALVESVSLFDIGDGTPHLHLDRSPLAELFGDRTTARAVYGPKGDRMLLWPDKAPVPQQVTPDQWSPRPVLVTENLAGQPARVLRLQVRAPTGHRYGLLLARSLRDVDDTLRRYYQAASVVTVLAVLLLLLGQRWQSTWLQRRLDRLGAHMRRLEQGDLSEDPAPDEEQDELSDLRTSIASATIQLRQARQARDRLIADAAHELRTPLTAARMEIDLAVRRERTHEELLAVLLRLRDETDRLGSMTHRLLNMAALRASPLNRTSVNVATLLDEAVARAQTLATADDVLLQLEPSASMTVSGSADELSQALDNLLANAMRFAVAGHPEREPGVAPAVDVSVRIERADNHVAGGALDEAVIAVQDNGPGVGDGETKALFAPFHRRHRVGAGTGLGLAIVADIVGRHAGSVDFVASESGGARVEVRLPLAQEGSDDYT